MLPILWHTVSFYFPWIGLPKICGILMSDIELARPWTRHEQRSIWCRKSRAGFAGTQPRRQTPWGSNRCVRGGDDRARQGCGYIVWSKLDDGPWLGATEEVSVVYRRSRTRQEGVMRFPELLLSSELQRGWQSNIWTTPCCLNKHWLLVI